MLVINVMQVQSNESLINVIKTFNKHHEDQGVGHRKFWSIDKTSFVSFLNMGPPEYPMSWSRESRSSREIIEEGESAASNMYYYFICKGWLAKK